MLAAGEAMTEPVTYTPPEPNAALVVGPDDQLVITLPATTEQKDFTEFLTAMTRRFGTRVTVVCGPEQIAVVRTIPGEEPKS